MCLPNNRVQEVIIYSESEKLSEFTNREEWDVRSKFRIVADSDEFQFNHT